MSIPGSAEPLLLAQQDTGYTISRSLRFNSSDSAYLSRTPSSSGNRRTWTFACWVKNAFTPSANPRIFSAGSSTSNTTEITLLGTGEGSELRVLGDTGGVRKMNWTTANKFRDPSAWFHLVVALDTTQATAANRLKVYINGAQVTTAGAASTLPSQNDDFEVNNNSIHYIGRSGPYSEYMNGYLADVHLIEGLQLDPSSFVETSATTGQLIPKAYTGSYGTNGFWLKFSDNSAATATTLGKDYSGNSNNFTPNNLSVTAGAGNDSLVDTPTSYGTDTGTGGEVRGNYCTLNPLAKGGTHTLSNGNLDCSMSGSSGATSTFGTIGVSSGKWYWELAVTGAATSYYPGIGVETNPVPSVQSGSNTTGYTYLTTGEKLVNSTLTAYGASFTTGDIVSVALNMDAGTLTCYKNGVSQGQLVSGITGVAFPVIIGQISASGSLNFGQRPFAYTAPSGFKALCDTNLPAPVVAKPNTVMDVKLYTGNGSTQNITGLNFSPDFVWGKVRAYSTNHMLADVVRGATKRLISNLTNAEDTGSALTSFNSDGFSLDSGSAINQNGEAVVAWCWDAGSSTVTNTQGSITSQVRANASAGFSIVTYTGNSATDQTIGHGLGVVPGMVIVKSRGSTDPWVVYHTSLGATKFLYLNQTTGESIVAGYWGTPSSTTFGIKGGGWANNVNGVAMVAYCFAPVAGYSSFGSYTGNGSTDGPFVFTGMRPRWVMYKRSDLADNWVIVDSARDPINVTGNFLYPNLSNAEAAAPPVFDFVSNGFKVRRATDGTNANGGTFMWAAFAESPFQYSRAR